MSSFLHEPAYVWLFLGAVLVVFEACTAPGLGLFLGGLGAFCAGLLIKAGVVDSAATGVQFACFFGFTALWAAVLWKPLQKFRTTRRSAAGFSDMVGGTATVGQGGLTRGRVGQASWSGTLMNAELDASATTDSLPAGALVVIKAVSGTTLKVVPK